MNNLDSPFSISKGDIEICFTYFYFLGYSLNRDKRFIPNVSGFINRKWRDTEASYYLSNKYIEEVQLEHFHIDPDIAIGDNTILSVTADETAYKFNLKDPPLDDDSYESVGSIECSIFGNGYLSLTIRVTNISDIPAKHALKLIRHPELVKLPDREDGVGRLVLAMEGIASKLEDTLCNIINEYKLNSINAENGARNPLQPLSPEKKDGGNKIEQRTRPYIGVVFKFSDRKHHELSNIQLSIEKFVIAAARTTPSFLTDFIDAPGYLSESRNVYAPGRSIVLIGRRGWCVFDSQEQHPLSFRLGVIETTQFTIFSLFTAARAWRRYINDICKRGDNRFSTLNKRVHKMVHRHGLNFISNWYYIKQCNDAISSATSFLARSRLLAPTSGQSRMLEAHIISHTARASVKRCEDVTNLRQLEDTAAAKMLNYTDFLKISASYYQSVSSNHSRIGIFLGVAAIFISIVSIGIKLI